MIMAAPSSSLLAPSASYLEAKLFHPLAGHPAQWLCLPNRSPRSATSAAICQKAPRSIIVMATSEGQSDGVSSDVTDYTNSIQEAWDKVEDKYAVSTLAVVGLVALCASTGMISAIDRLPLVPGVLELVGIGYTGWFVYKNIFYKPDREVFMGKVKDTYDEIIGGN